MAAANFSTAEPIEVDINTGSDNSDTFEVSATLHPINASLKAFGEKVAKLVDDILGNDRTAVVVAEAVRAIQNYRKEQRLGWPTFIAFKNEAVCRIPTAGFKYDHYYLRQSVCNLMEIAFDPFFELTTDVLGGPILNEMVESALTKFPLGGTINYALLIDYIRTEAEQKGLRDEHFIYVCGPIDSIGVQNSGTLMNAEAQSAVNPSALLCDCHFGDVARNVEVFIWHSRSTAPADLYGDPDDSISFDHSALLHPIYTV